MLNNEKLAYDLALIYAKTKFEVANKNGVISSLYPSSEPEMELKLLVSLFNDAYNQYLSQDLSQITEL